MKHWFKLEKILSELLSELVENKIIQNGVEVILKSDKKTLLENYRGSKIGPFFSNSHKFP